MLIYRHEHDPQRPQGPDQAVRAECHFPSSRIAATLDAKRLGGQLLDAGTSVAANYRAACRARSRAEFIAKLGVVLEEADESLFWLELVVDAKLVPLQRADRLLIEADQLTAIFTASVRTAKGIRKPPGDRKSEESDH